MSIIEIKNVDGQVISTYDDNDKKWIWGKYDFSEANLERAYLEMEVWQEVILCRANLKEAEIYSGIFFMSDLSEANCELTKFWGTDLKEVNFTKANLKNAVFGKNNMGGAANVSGANFIDANLDGAKFDETRYDEKTIFPKHFNPEKNGLVRIKDK